MEFHSLSKTFNMTGWRVGAAVGNPDLVEALRVIKSNLDSGVPQAVQEMAIEALDNHNDWVIENNKGYQVRRDKVVDALRSIGLAVILPRQVFTFGHVCQRDTPLNNSQTRYSKIET